MLAGSLARSTRCYCRLSTHQHTRPLSSTLSRNRSSNSINGRGSPTNYADHAALRCLLTRKVRPFAAIQSRWTSSSSSSSSSLSSSSDTSSTKDSIIEMANPIACLSLTHTAIRLGLNSLSMSVVSRHSRETRRKMMDLDRVINLHKKQEAYALQNGPMLGLSSMSGSDSREMSEKKDELEMVKHENYKHYLAMERAKYTVIERISAVDDSDDVSSVSVCSSSSLSSDSKDESRTYRLCGQTHDTSEEDWRAVANVLGEWTDAYLMHLTYKDTHIVPKLLDSPGMMIEDEKEKEEVSMAMKQGARMKKILDIDRDELNAFQAPWVMSQLVDSLPSPKNYQLSAEYIQAVQFSSTPDQYLVFLASIKKYISSDFWYRIETARYLDESGKQ